MNWDALLSPPVVTFIRLGFGSVLLLITCLSIQGVGTLEIVGLVQVEIGTVIVQLKPQKSM